MHHQEHWKRPKEEMPHYHPIQISYAIIQRERVGKTIKRPKKLTLATCKKKTISNTMTWLNLPRPEDSVPNREKEKAEMLDSWVGHTVRGGCGHLKDPTAKSVEQVVLNKKKNLGQERRGRARRPTQSFAWLCGP